MKYFKNKNFNLLVFLIFVLVSFLASFNIFKKFFLNKGFNGDEYYLDNVYQLSKVNFEIITSIPSQFYLFLASILNVFIDNPKTSTRLTFISFKSDSKSIGVLPSNANLYEY